MIHSPPTFRRRAALGYFATLLLVGCASAIAGQESSSPAQTASNTASGVVATPPAPLDSPPESDPAPRVAFPKIVDSTLENGLKIRSVARDSLPLVELNLIVFSGTESDSSQRGVSRLTSLLLKDGGAGKWTGETLVEFAESLGATLRVSAERDRSIVSLAFTAQHLAPAMDVLAAIVQGPRFDHAEFTKLRDREIERVSSLARTSGRWSASMVLFRELFDLPAGSHPYSVYDAGPDEIRALTLAHCRQWYRQHVVPTNAALVAVGAVDPAQVEAEAKRVFGNWKGSSPERSTHAAPQPPKSLEIHVVDRPGSTQSDIYVALLGPERRSPEWASIDAANQVLGGGVAGRLFLDVREKRSLAYRTGSSLHEVAEGPVPIVLTAGTRTEKTTETVRALLNHVDRLGSLPVSTTELETATMYLADSLLINTETISALASLSGALLVLGLPKEHYDNYRATIREVSPEALLRAARRYFSRNKAIVVVAGAAEAITPSLSRLAPVVVLNPEKRFTIERHVPLNPAPTPQE